VNTLRINRRDFFITTPGTCFLSKVAEAAVLPPDFLRCVVSIGVDDLVVEEGKQVIRWTAHAAGFLYESALPNKEGEEQKFWVYIITCGHVLRGQTQINLRFNSLSGNAAKYPVPLTGPNAASMFFHPGLDLAVIRLNAGILERDGVDYRAFGLSDLATRESIEKEGIAVGDGVFVLGFPVGIAGVERNFVVAKQGIIARLAATQDSKQTTEYLIDAMVFPGNSGGPVITRFEIASITGTKAVKRSYLLGVVSQFIPYTDVAVSKQTNHARITFEENSGLASVIPADYIEETIQMHTKALDVSTPKPK